mmetsp:Transcript_31093/g.71883  ORF Transcript_31093/g.71883 Transcript_31093/m.71883 type:complete len:215 (+) Transcript_31093:1649-2293(+)
MVRGLGGGVAHAAGHHVDCLLLSPLDRSGLPRRLPVVPRHRAANRCHRHNVRLLPRPVVQECGRRAVAPRAFAHAYDHLLRLPLQPQRGEGLFLGVLVYKFLPIRIHAAHRQRVQPRHFRQLRAGQGRAVPARLRQGRSLDRLLRPGPGHPRVGAARLPLHFAGLPRVPHRRRVLLHPLPGAQALRLGAAGFRWLRTRASPASFWVWHAPSPGA